MIPIVGLVAAALGAPATVRVMGPDESIATHVAELPWSLVLTDGRLAGEFYVSFFDGPHGILEVSVGPLRGEHPKPRRRASRELDPATPATLSIRWRGRVWAAEVTLPPA